MTKVEEFNKRYGLNVSTNAFKEVKEVDVANDLAGKPKKNIAQVFVRFFRNPVALISTVVFIILILIALIVPALSDYDADRIVQQTPQSQPGAPKSSEFINMPRSGDMLEEFVSRSELRHFQNFTKLHPEFTFEVVPVNGVSGGVTGQTLIKYDPEQYISILDDFDHKFIIGTDASGRDIWTRTWAGTANSLWLAVVVAVITTVIGTFLGSWIGYYVGSIADIIAIKLLYVINSVPMIVWYIVISSLLPESTFAEIVLFSILGWTTTFGRARMFMWRHVNSDVNRAAKTLGVPLFGRIFKHLLPNYIGYIALAFVGTIPATIESQAGLGFIGISPNPSGASLGNVLNEMQGSIGGDGVDNTWYVLMPSMIIFTITLSLKYVALGLSDAMEPKYTKR